jgi:hypothetical protein
MKYVIKETKETCVVIENYEDLFGNKMAKVRTESGQIVEVAQEDIVQFLQD